MKTTVETLYFGVYQISSGDTLESEGFETEDEVRTYFDERNEKISDDRDQWIERRKIKTQRIELY